MDQSIYNKARRDKFAMVFDIPVALRRKALEVQKSGCNVNLEAFAANSIQFSLYGTPVPRVSIREVDLPYIGQVHRQTSYARPTYAPLTIGMTIDNQFTNYWLLWTWLNLWNDTRTAQFDPAIMGNTTSTSIVDYVTSLTIYGLDEYNNKVISFKYKSVIITDLSEIEFSFRNTEEIGCTATFVFDQLYVDLINPTC